MICLLHTTCGALFCDFFCVFPATLCPAVLQLWSASVSAWNWQHGRAEMGIPACCVLGVRENVENPAELNCVHTIKIRDVFFNYVFGTLALYGSALPIWLPLGLVSSYEWTKEWHWCVSPAQIFSDCWRVCRDPSSLMRFFSSFTDLLKDLARGYRKLTFCAQPTIAKNTWHSILFLVAWAKNTRNINLKWTGRVGHVRKSTAPVAGHWGVRILRPSQMFGPVRGDPHRHQGRSPRG